MPNYYLAFTIGPIYRTMDGARFTRELWASSYLFSYLVKDITRRIRTELPEAKFVVPAIENGLDDLFEHANKRRKKTYGAGLFPDRFILKTTGPNQLETLQTILDATLTHLAKRMDKTAGIKGKHDSDVRTYLKNYLQLYALELSLPEDANVILRIMPYLDTLELQRNVNSTDQSFLRDLFDRVTKSFLAEDAFGRSHSFETILEVAARDFKELPVYQKIAQKRNPTVVSFTEAIGESGTAEPEPLAEETALITYLTEHHAASRDQQLVFRPAHKYVAVVQADGDNVGAVIKGLKPDTYLGFSKMLGDFAQEAAGMIDEYGGMNIYAGGDDLLFFAPVLRGNRTIFDLLVDLDEVFTVAFADFPVGEEGTRPTLSFGVSITYHKFPLYEARQAAATQLFGVAKEAVGKNTIGLRVQKHSGQPFGEAFRMSSASFRQLQKLLKLPVSDAERALTSVVHKVRENEFLLREIGDDKDALQAFFDNSFNEDIHRGEAKTYLNAVVELLHDCFLEHADDTKKALGAAYALLRTYGFLTSTELN